MQRLGRGWFTPPFDQQLDHGYRTHQFQPEAIGNVALTVKPSLHCILSQDRRLPGTPSRASQALSQGRNTERRPELGNAGDVADVDAQFQRRGADCRRRQGAVLETPFHEIPVLARGGYQHTQGALLGHGPDCPLPCRTKPVDQVVGLGRQTGIAIK